MEQIRKTEIIRVIIAISAAALVISGIVAFLLFRGDDAQARGDLGDTAAAQLVCEKDECKDDSCCESAEAVYNELKNAEKNKAESCCADA